MKRIISYFVLVILISIVGCAKKESVATDNIVKIDNKLFTKDDINDFLAMKFLFPIIKEGGYFPGKISNVTLFIETNMLYKESLKFKKVMKNDKEFQLLQMAFKGHVYNYSIIKRRMGLTDKELMAFYESVQEKNPSAFGGIGSNFYRQQLVVQESLFVEKYFPDIKAYQNVKAPKYILKTIWKNEVKKDLTGFFIKKYFNEKYGNNYNLDYETIVNKLQVVTEDEIKIVLNWFPKDAIETQGKKFRWIITRQILGWKLFNEKLKDKELQEQLDLGNRVAWFKKYSSVYYYLNKIIYPKFNKNPKPYYLDTTAIICKYYNSNGSADESVTKERLQPIYDSLLSNYVDDKVDEFIRKRRDRVSIKFYSDISNDNLDYSANELIVRADSLYNSSSYYTNSIVLYINVIKNFGIEPEAILAYKKMADIYYEKNEYDKAILSYLNYFIREKNIINGSQLYFNVGYIYMTQKKLSLAREFFKLILKKYPNSKEASDVEFIMNHLGEPLPEIEELQQQSLRRGEN